MRIKKAAIPLVPAMCWSLNAIAADEPLRIGFITDMSDTYADFSSFVLQAKNSNAQILDLATVGDDLMPSRAPTNSASARR